MADPVCARDLMLAEVATLQSGRTLREALDALVALQGEPERPNVLAVVDANGRFDGLITAHLLAKSLLALWMPAATQGRAPAELHRELLTVARERSSQSVHDTLVRGLPRVAPQARLVELIEAACEPRLDFVPVVEDGVLLGVVPITAVFQAAAALALTPRDEGFQTGAP